MVCFLQCFNSFCRQKAVTYRTKIKKQVDYEHSEIKKT